jgi:copper(I)-binding protein
MKLTLSLLTATALTLSAGIAMAHDFKVGPLKIGHPWTRATPAGAKVGGGYLSVENNGGVADRLVSASATFAGRTEIHEMAVTNGVMTMRPLDKGVEIAPGTKLEFKPGGYHIMFMDLKQPIVQGTMPKATLTFEKAGTIEVELKVEPVGSRGSAEAGHKH